MNPGLNSISLRTAVLDHWEKYKKLPGSEAIASKAALLSMVSIALIRPPRKLLEVGAGLGTISNLILDFTSAQIVSTEPVPELFEVLKSRESARHQIVQDESMIDPLVFCPDWMIIDGPCDMTSLINLMDSATLEVVIIENQRIRTRVQVAFSLYKKGIRFNYCELDSSDQTGIATFLTISPKIASYSKFGNVLDLMAFLVRLGPRFIKQLFASRGKSLKVGSTLEGATGI